MQITSVTFHNYRVYLGAQTIDLGTPRPGKPVILIGGMNGEGKTSFLEGIQLALYGRRSELWSSSNGSYNDYLLQSIHRSADKADGAMVTVEFDAVDEGVTKRIKVQRSWKSRDGVKVTEYVQVFVDGHLDKLLSETWSDQVERYIPARLAGLFFFDGEKIKHYADPQRAQELIERGLFSLLGLDLVDQLDTDLKALEAKIGKQARTKKNDAELDALEAECTRFHEEVCRLKDRSAELLTQHDRQLNACNTLDKDFSKVGGEIYEQRVDLEARKRGLLDRAASTRQALVELSGGALPLGLVETALAKCMMQARIEISARAATNALSFQSEQAGRLLDALKRTKAAARTTKTVEQFFEDEAAELREVSAIPTYLDADESDVVRIAGLLDEGLPTARRQAADLIATAEELDAALQAVDRKLAAVPEDAAVERVQAERESARHKLAQVEGKIDQVSEELRLAKSRLEEAESQLHKAAVKMLESAQDQSDNVRTLDHAERVRKTLRIFRERMVVKRVGSLTESIQESYAHLMRKKGIVSTIGICPESYRLTLYNKGGEEILAEWLSAGERQLLVVSILWGLARASGRSLPVIVDTPVGRLDSQHRYNLVRHYFPHASHQVVLLSTDEEIIGKSLRELKPAIGAMYRLSYDDMTESTRIEPGYFKEKAGAH